MNKFFEYWWEWIKALNRAALFGAFMMSFVLGVACVLGVAWMDHDFHLKLLISLYMKFTIGYEIFAALFGAIWSLCWVIQDKKK